MPGSVVLSGDQKITYSLPKSSGTTDKSFTYQTMTENIPGTPIGHSSPSPDITKKSRTFHQEAKFYREDHQGGSPPYDGSQPSYGYRTDPSTNTETRTTMTKQYYQADGNYPNGHGPDYPGSTIIYQNQTPTVTHTKTFNRIEEYGSGRPPSSGSHHPTFDKPDTPTKTSYYPQHGTPPQSSTTIYKFSNTTTTVPPSKNADDHEVLLPKPFPTDAYHKPTKPITNGEGPPAKLEDLMASFSDSEVK